MLSELGKRASENCRALGRPTVEFRGLSRNCTVSLTAQCMAMPRLNGRPDVSKLRVEGLPSRKYLTRSVLS